MIWAALFYGLYVMIGGSSLSIAGEWLLKQVQPNILLEIQDKERSKSVKKGFKEISGEIKKFNKQSKSNAKKFQELIKNYSSTSKEFETLQEQDRTTNDQYINNALERISNLKSLIKKEEWEAAIKTTKEVVPAVSKITVRNLSVKKIDKTHFLVSWEADPSAYPIIIYWSKTPHAFEDKEDTPLIANKNESEMEVELPISLPRPYFLIKPKRGDSRVVAERFLPLAGQENCRDLGGYPTKEGGYVKWGQIYRCGNLSELTSGDKSYLQSLGIVRNIDLRTKEESDRWPNRLPFDGWHLCPDLLEDRYPRRCI